MPRQRNSGATQRDLLNHGLNGKGDRDHTSDRARYVRNMGELNLPGHVEGLKPVGGGKLRKVYV